MTTLAQKIIKVAESQIGVHEYGGANRGGSERYQRPYGAWMVGQPWCATFVGWCWGQAGVPGWKNIATPSTGQNCSIARSRGLVCPPKPGAAFVMCGTHTGLLHHYLGNGVWKTIEGNSGDAVAWRSRSLGGLLIYAPPGMSGAVEPPRPVMETWFYLEDVAVKEYYGGWGSKSARDKAQRSLEKKLGFKLRPFRDDSNKKAPYFLQNPRVSQFYGGWSSKKARASAKKQLEKKLKRKLREFSEQRPSKREGSGRPDALGKVT